MASQADEFIPSFDSEIIIGLCGAVGTDLGRVVEFLTRRLSLCRYKIQYVKLSSAVIKEYFAPQTKSVNPSEYERISSYMDAGNKARDTAGDNSILALGAIATIRNLAESESGERTSVPRTAVIVDSLKHPEEVKRFRQVYPEGFYLLGVHSDAARRRRHLTDDKNIATQDADALMARDKDENLDFGQKVTDTFHLSDFFVRIDGDDDRLQNSITRIIDILFGHPFKTPTFDEYAMFLAFSASLRSADLSRQVGAVIARDKEVIATGANDCPKFGGGLYWPDFDPVSKSITDTPNGRDYTRCHPEKKRGFDSNKFEQKRIIDDIRKSALEGFKKQMRNHPAVKRKSLTDGTLKELQDKLSECLNDTLLRSGIGDLTEFGRVVHAEMEAILTCARSNSSTKGATLYGTTFPCHNCAKHIIASGISRVVYIEPYEKSRAEQFHDDSISFGFSKCSDRVQFEPFVGVGPRRFFDLFSTKLGSGYPIGRKDDDGIASDWSAADSNARLQMSPGSYLELETVMVEKFQQLLCGQDVTHEE